MIQNPTVRRPRPVTPDHNPDGSTNPRILRLHARAPALRALPTEVGDSACSTYQPDRGRRTGLWGPVFAAIALALLLVLRALRRQPGRWFGRAPVPLWPGTFGPGLLKQVEHVRPGRVAAGRLCLPAGRYLGLLPCG